MVSGRVRDAQRSQVAVLHRAVWDQDHMGEIVGQIENHFEHGTIVEGQPLEAWRKFRVSKPPAVCDVLEDRPAEFLFERLHAVARLDNNEAHIPEIPAELVTEFDQ